MKKHKIKILLAVFVVLLSVFTAKTALAADVSFTSNTTVEVNSYDYTVLSGSEATSMTVNATTLTVTVPASSTFTFVSTDRYVLNNDQGFTEQCTSSDNRLVITGPVTVLITPDPPNICGTPPPPPPPGGGVVFIPSAIETTSILRSDFNSGGEVDLIDFAMLVFYWGSEEKPRPDINKDGAVDLIDFAILIFDWTG